MPQDYSDPNWGLEEDFSDPNWGMDVPQSPRINYPTRTPSKIPQPKTGGWLSSIHEQFNTPIVRASRLPSPLPNFSMGRGLDVVNPNTAADVAESFTTPYSIGTSVAGPISRLGGPAITAGKILGRGMGAIQGAEGISELSGGDIGSGLLNTAMGGLGMFQKYGKLPKVMGPPEPISESIPTIPGKRRLGAAPEYKQLGPATNPEVIPRDPEVIANLDEGWQLVGPEESNVIQIPKKSNYTIGQNRISVRGEYLPPPQSTGAPDITIPGRYKPVTSGEAAFNAMIPERYKDQTTPWSGAIGQSGELPALPPKFNPGGITEVGSPNPALKIKPQELPVYGGVTPEKKAQPIFDYPKTGRTVTITNPKLKGAQELLKKVKSGEEVKSIPSADAKEARQVLSPLSWKDRFEDWAFARNATDYQGLQKKKEFAELDKMGLNAINEIQEGKPFEKVRKYFNDKYSEVSKVIPDIKYRENYLPQLWSNPQEEIDMVFGKGKLSLRPSFTLERVIEDYKAGIAKGLKPKFENVSDLVGWYEQKANKALADREFFNYLKEAKVIKPTAAVQTDKGWSSLNPDTFPIIVAGKQSKGMAWSAPEEVAQVINNYLRDETKTNIAQKGLSALGTFTSHAKNIMLTGGIPKTGLNWHTAVSTPTRALVSDGIGRMLKNYYYDLNPKAAASYIDENLDMAIDAVKHGMGLGVEGFWANALPKDKNIFQKAEELFSAPAFKEILPAIKLQTWEKTWQSFAAKGMNIKEAKKAAAKFTNDAYGGLQNPERNKDIQNLLRSALLAPDWAETKLNLAKGALKGLTNPSDPLGQKYLKTVAGMVGLLSSQIALGVGKRNGDIPQSPSRLSNIPLGDVEGKEAEFVPSGTALDSVGIPAKVGVDIAQGNPARTIESLRYQLSPTIQYGLDVLNKEDSLGNPLRTTDRFGNKVPYQDVLLNNISNILNYTMPQPIQAVFNYAVGKAGPVESTTKVIEAPVRFYQKRRNQR